LTFIKNIFIFNFSYYIINLVLEIYYFVEINSLMRRSKMHPSGYAVLSLIILLILLAIGSEVSFLMEIFKG